MFQTTLLSPDIFLLIPDATCTDDLLTKLSIIMVYLALSKPSEASKSYGVSELINDYPLVLEPYAPWSNATEKKKKEITKWACCKLLKSKAPKHLWDNC